MSGFISGAGGRLTARRLVVSVAACLAVTAAIVAIAPLIGRYGTRWELLGASALDPGSPDHQVLWFRITRALACALTGAALAGAGCALQAILRNPLAEPFTLGISSGSSLAAVLAIRLGAEAAFGRGGVAIAALLGAAVTLAVVWQLGRIGRQLPPATLILAGITISMMCAAASVLIQYTSDFQDVSHMLTWMVGGLESVQLSWVEYATPPILLGLVVLAAYARELNALAAGPEAAASVGVAVGRTQNVVFAVASLLVGTAISLVGPIGFVGLIIPHALRSFLGPDHRVLLPTSMLGGAAVLTVCDTLARTVAPMNHLPTGALTAVLGASFFLVILVGHKRKASLWGRA
jgi:ABC-type Fe3+-siderophore transport system permease subunit